MNEQVTQLLEQLAMKLGTTTEYLWNILLRQAYISATTDLIFFMIACILGYLLYKLHIRLSDDDKEVSYYMTGDIVIIPVVLSAIIWGVFFLIMLFSWGNIISGYFNPEYWALKQILNLI